MKLRLFLALIAIVYSRSVLNKDKKNSLIIDFSDRLKQIDVDPNFNIEIHSTKPCKWFIPSKIRQNNEVIINNHTLSIKKVNKTLIDINGNLSICANKLTKETNLFIYDIPECCPCCEWYNQQYCQSFYEKIENCTTIILYMFIKTEIELIHKQIYDKVMFQLPCPMYKSEFRNNLLIENMMSPTKYLQYVNRTLITNTAGFHYNPTTGLCFNTSELQHVTNYFSCIYDDSRLEFILKKIDFSTDSIHSSLILVSNGTNTLLINETAIKVVQNTTFKIRCKAKYMFDQKWRMIMCMKFSIITNQSDNFNCSEFSDSLINELVINSENIRNESKLQCLTINPSRDVSANIETTIYKFDHEHLSIRNYDFWNNKEFKIFNNVTTFDLTVFYDVIPSNSPVTCNCIENVSVKLQIRCVMTIAEQCYCQISTENLFLSRLNVSLTISISNENFIKSFIIFLKAIYLKKPVLLGLTTKNEAQKTISCNVDASEPFNITWNVAYDNNERRSYITATHNIVIPLNNDTNRICVSCGVKNEAGRAISDEVCKNIIDVDMHENKTLQIFLVNPIQWPKRPERKHVLTFSGNKTQIINLLDLQPVFIKCVSRIRNETIELFFNDSTSVAMKNGTQVTTIYTLQKTIELDTKSLASVNMPVKYYCQQKSNIDETYFIRFLKTILPRIHLYEDSNRQILIGQNIQYTIGLLSFPPGKLKLLKVIKFEKNDSYYYSEIDSKKVKITKISENHSVSTFEMVITNFSIGDAGKYSITAVNIRGTDSHILTLQPWPISNNYLRVYVILGSIIVITVLCLIFVAFYCKKTGYAIPIIQIQNHLYKSLDGDSLMILSTIWPDPLERIRWTIKPSSRIKVKEIIGGGNYGVVYTGILKNSDSSEELVALKYPILSKPTNTDKPNGPSQFCQISLDCFINEIRILSLLRNCPNIIKLYGCVVLRDWINDKVGVKEPTTMVVLEFCSNYSLSEFLSKNAPHFAPYTRHRKFTLPNGYTGMKMDEGITLLDLKRIALGISTGLQYLSGLNIIHRDLATRNILIDEKKMPKICDFGLAIELDNKYSLSNSYQILTYNKALPYKILAPEALESKIFYLESDIWSFSLLLWEMFNLEKEIIFAHINSPGELLRYINGKLGGSKTDNILSMPLYADESIWELITSCWTLNPFQRPSADIIHSRLMDIVRNSPVEVIRVSSSCQSEIYDSSGRDSIGSSKFPSACTSIITLNVASSYSDETNNNNQSCKEFCHQDLIDESLM